MTRLAVGMDIREEVKDELPATYQPLMQYAEHLCLYHVKFSKIVKQQVVVLALMSLIICIKRISNFQFRVSQKIQIKIYNDIYAYHCRGWNKDRKSVPYWSRLVSAKNDIKIALSYRVKNLPFAYIKYLYVRFLRLDNLKILFACQIVKKYINGVWKKGRGTS